MLLLAASLYFYACWKVEYLGLILFSTVIDYLAGLMIERATTLGRRRLFLTVSLTTNLGLLFAFKYANFFGDNLRLLFQQFNLLHEIPHFDVLLPIGISFYTFQTMSYAIDVYRGKRKAERHFGMFALYVCFFPQLVAGPIERSTRLLPQLYKIQEFDWTRIRSGLLLILWGFFKKLVIADRVGIYVDEIFNYPDAHHGLPILVAFYFFVFQLYCDFSGYTDIAIGTARIFGIKLMENFQRPFAARTYADFWQRWHISLTRWIMDYMYAPLVRSNSRFSNRHFAIIATMTAIGFWHGAAWNFVLFGFVAGGVLVVERLSKEWREKLTVRLFPSNNPVATKIHHLLQVAIIFHIVVLTGILFRLNQMSDFPLLVNNLLAGSFSLSKSNLTLDVFNSFELQISIIAIVFLELVQWNKGNDFDRLLELPACWRWPAYYCALVIILIFGSFNLTPFVYFQF
jgi:D-alanyl-lipoteichoic acid acyltransferase DltB (MBOAT superfamily)